MTERKRWRKWQQRIDSMSHDEFEAFGRVLDLAAQSKVQRARASRSSIYEPGERENCQGKGQVDGNSTSTPDQGGLVSPR